MRTTTRPIWTSKNALVIAVAAVLLLSGCANDPDENAQAAASSGGSSHSEGENSRDAEDTGDSDDANGSDAEDTSTGELTGKECLPGNWFLDNAEFGKLMSSVSGRAVDKVTGTVMLTLTADGTTKTSYENWTHSITVDGGATVTIVKNGTDTGTYAIKDNGTMSLVDVKISSKTTSKMSIDGHVVSTAVTPEPSVFSQASFTCAGDKLTVSADGASTVMHREH